MKNDFSFLLHKYMTSYLVDERGYSNNTVSTYRYTFILFFEFLSTLSIRPDKFELKDFNRNLIIRYLTYLEAEKRSSVNTVNNRLATILSFTKFLTYEYPDYLNNYSEILGIKFKKSILSTVNFLDIEGIRLLISKTNKNTPSNYRDYMILFLLYETGARVSEISNIRKHDFHTTKPFYIKITGKGNKERLVPLAEQVIDEVKNYLVQMKLDKKPGDTLLFTNNQNGKITRAGISYILDKYVGLAKDENSELIPYKVTPHTIRHSKAMHLLQNGVNLVYIRDFLGHTSIQTTEIYARASSKLKQEAIENAYIDLCPKEEPEWKSEEILEWLKKFV